MNWQEGTPTVGPFQARRCTQPRAGTKVRKAPTTLYTEQDLVRIAGSFPPNGGPHLTRHWLATETADELRRRIDEAVQALGFEWLSYRSVVILAGMVVDRQLLTSHAHPEWLRIYREGASDEMPSGCQSARLSTLPIVWSVDDAGSWRPHERLVPAQLCCPQLLRDCGIESGVLIALPTRCSATRTVCELSSRTPGHAWIDGDVLSRSLMFSWCLHDLLTVHTRISEKADCNKIISPTRRKILRCLAEGQSNKQIAHELQLSSDTVKYHLRELQRHLNVRNRLQLVNLTSLVEDL
jgi:DNA-binding CsgD family transcriptional regulator